MKVTIGLQEMFKIKHKTGFSLVELLLVLGVIAVLLVAAFVIYPRVKLANQVHQERSSLLVLQSGIRSSLASQGGNYKTLGTVSETKGNAFAYGAKAVPSAWNASATNPTDIVNGWGGKVIIHSTVGTFEGYSAGKAFGIQYNDVPKEACVKFVTENLGNFVAAWVNGSTGVGTYLTPNSSVEKIVERCELQPLATIHFVSD